MKVEGMPDHHIKPEPTDSPSPFVDEDEDMYEDAGDLDFSRVGQSMWLSHIPRSLWEALAKLDDVDEIEIGTIRTEGADESGRVRLAHSLPFHATTKSDVS
jgi:transcription initiation factor TFIIF subunit beta